ncbi:SDR family oxidoreductase [Pantoea piersonii]|uniref:SDR family oxidoreductase n=1 Tax=Pantoea piersonii TaxID=2364647 RepID=A0AAJ5QP41_9GAMM|nr:SDR family oxidoreductase [Pantoea piersonii]WBG92519.1 SDR family oxidoreductase [Pantoea piersonii]
MSNGISGKVIVITGASSGLGECTARHLSALGAILILGARRTERLQTLVTELEKQGGKAIAVATDVTRKEQVEALIKTAVEKFGRVDVLLNNAGLMQQSRLDSLKTDEWDNMIDVNLKGTLYGIAAVLPYMQAQKSGHIINVSSVAGHKVTPAGSVYCATKHAVRAISEGLRSEVKEWNLRTTIISPGAVATELTDHITEKEIGQGMRDFYKQHAVGPDSFARIVEFALSQPAEVDINEILYRPTSQEV